MSVSLVVLIAASGRPDTSWKPRVQLIGCILLQSAPLGQHNALEEESRDMHVESEEQQKSAGSFVSAQREKLEFAHVEACRPSRIPSACAADTATMRAEADGTMDEARQTSASFEIGDRGAMISLHFLIIEPMSGADVETNCFGQKY